MNTDKTVEKQRRVVGKPFAKGVSGNPAGRPKGSFSIKDKIRHFLEENPKEVDEIVKYFVRDNRELMWTMLEGRPNVVSSSKIEPIENYELDEDDIWMIEQMRKLEKERGASTD